jgi:hypothetical protein
VNRIGVSAFVDCSRLKSICIPTAVESLDESCFDGCAALSQVTFEPGSSLVHIGSHAFERCMSFTSICIPVEIRHLPNYCFRHCESFEELTFARGSQFSRFANQALSGCFSLPLLVIPSRLGILEVGVFLDCESLCELIFEAESRLKRLSRPPSQTIVSRFSGEGLEASTIKCGFWSLVVNHGWWTVTSLNACTIHARSKVPFSFVYLKRY